MVFQIWHDNSFLPALSSGPFFRPFLPARSGVCSDRQSEPALFAPDGSFSRRAFVPRGRPDCWRAQILEGRTMPFPAGCVQARRRSTTVGGGGGGGVAPPGP